MSTGCLGVSPSPRPAAPTSSSCIGSALVHCSATVRRPALGCSLPIPLHQRQRQRQRNYYKWHTIIIYAAAVTQWSKCISAKGLSRRKGEERGKNGAGGVIWGWGCSSDNSGSTSTQPLGFTSVAAAAVTGYAQGKPGTGKSTNY